MGLIVPKPIMPMMPMVPSVHGPLLEDRTFSPPLGDGKALDILIRQKGVEMTLVF